MAARMISDVLLIYLHGLIVNTYGDPISTGRDYESWADVLEDFRGQNEVGDFDDEYDIPASWQVDDGEPITEDYDDE